MDKTKKSDIFPSCSKPGRNRLSINIGKQMNHNIGKQVSKDNNCFFTFSWCPKYFSEIYGKFQQSGKTETHDCHFYIYKNKIFIFIKNKN